MPHDGQSLAEGPLLADLLSLTARTLPEIEALFHQAREGLRDAVTVAGKPSAPLLDQRQDQAHALAWLATYLEGLRQLRGWAGRVSDADQFGEMEALILQIGFGEYLAQILGGIPMSQLESARLSDLGVAWTPSPDAARLIHDGNTPPPVPDWWS
jgi:(2S)-methylsuccinyl-CoA dehydrogenase